MEQIKRKPTKKEYYHYKGKYFVGMVDNNKAQFLHYNKKGFELQNGLSPKAAIFNYDNADHNKRFKTIANSPFKFCYKIDCLEYLFGITKPTNIIQQLINFLRSKWSN